MDSVTNTSGERSRSKRSASRTRIESVQSETPPTQESPTSGSRKYSGTAALYRFTVLRKTGIHIRHHPAPEKIRAQIDAIVYSDISLERGERLSLLAHQSSDQFIEVLGRTAREGEFIDILFRLLRSIDEKQRLVLARDTSMGPEQSF